MVIVVVVIKKMYKVIFILYYFLCDRYDFLVYLFLMLMLWILWLKIIRVDIEFVDSCFFLLRKIGKKRYVLFDGNYFCFSFYVYCKYLVFEIEIKNFNNV